MFQDHFAYIKYLLTSMCRICLNICTSKRQTHTCTDKRNQMDLSVCPFVGASHTHTHTHTHAVYIYIYAWIFQYFLSTCTNVSVCVNMRVSFGRSPIFFCFFCFCNVLDACCLLCYRLSSVLCRIVRPLVRFSLFVI